jgi:hypothetical protein
VLVISLPRSDRLNRGIVAIPAILKDHQRTLPQRGLVIRPRGDCPTC